ncbi:hypothetical protein H696_05252 [Fonticula alba]|uniref:Cation-transporting P-type ATPase N-terminal domain-containing protein n=1 Tax=Fonticula alba TaxID=691883 RepID=A0A058Z239_FONAL|nr:hypothetical protein H696_05252 [Fonticula alba]KCV68335.1 hypothetical protein H696_05252 [Fonticula alba]|eukprot:XP_009497389.1 hypothetical protein H696_05252 [Fonticula alba]
MDSRDGASALMGSFDPAPDATLPNNDTVSVPPAADVTDTHDADGVAVADSSELPSSASDGTSASLKAESLGGESCSSVEGVSQAHKPDAEADPSVSLASVHLTPEAAPPVSVEVPDAKADLLAPEEVVSPGPAARPAGSAAAATRRRRGSIIHSDAGLPNVQALAEAITSGADTSSLYGAGAGRPRSNSIYSVSSQAPSLTEIVVADEHYNKPPFCIDHAVVTRIFGVNPKRGLSSAEAATRMLNHGPNELTGDSKINIWMILFDNLVNPMMIVLTVCLIISIVTSQWIEAVVLIIFIIVNGTISFVQELRSEKTLQALRMISSPVARILRDGRLVEVSATEVTIGDIIEIVEGDQIGADIRLIKAVNLRIDEALLTGETVPAAKVTHAIDDPLCPLGDQRNMAFKSTVVTQGHGRGVVTSIGMDTAIGRIAKAVLSGGPASTKTPVQRQLNVLLYILLVMALLFALTVMAVNKFNFKDKTILLYALAVSVAVIPEGLPAVVTVVYAYAVQRMTRQKAIIRKLNSLEGLGTATNICSDKTGTITIGQMVATEFWTPTAHCKVTGQDMDSGGQFLLKEDSRHPGEQVLSADGTTSDAAAAGASPRASTQRVLPFDRVSEDIRHLLQACTLCATATITLHEEEWVTAGDPTEVALVVLAGKAGVMRPDLERDWTFASEFPFDASLKRMTMIYHAPRLGQTLTYIKGATEVVLERCVTRVGGDDGTTVVPIDAAFCAQVMGIAERMSMQTLRVLAFGYRLDKYDPDGRVQTIEDRDANERDFIFLGLVGMFDPPRPESYEAVRICHEAGITVHMATGDHPLTAHAIAENVGIVPENCPSWMVMVARDFDAMTDEEIDKMTELPRVLARCSPESKVKLIESLHRRKKIVVMTGDGVNDAPAVKYADVGVAMGHGGTDVTKQAADLVVTDDNFMTIVRAVAEGRRVINNTSKFIRLLMTVCLAQLVVLACALAFSDSSGHSIFPLSAIQILWINLMTAGPQAMGVGTMEGTKENMEVPPRTARSVVFSWEILCDVLVFSAFIGLLSLAMFVWAIESASPIGFDVVSCNDRASFGDPGCAEIFRARTVCFNSMMLMLITHAWVMVVPNQSLIRVPFRLTRNLALTSIASVILLFPLIYVPFINLDVFGQAPITWEFAFIFGSFGVYLIFCELYKLLKYLILRKLVPWIRSRRRAAAPADAHEMTALNIKDGDFYHGYRSPPMGAPASSRLSNASRPSFSQ